MHASRRSISSSVVRSYGASAGAVGRPVARSSTLRRAGSTLYSEPLTPPGTGASGSQTYSGSSPPLSNGGGQACIAETDGGDSGSAIVASSMTETTEEIPCGVTPASVKHLRRQCGKLEEAKAKLQEESVVLTAQCKEQKARVSVLQEEVSQFDEKLAAVRKEVEEAQANEERQRCLADRLDKQNQRLEELLAGKEHEIARLKQALEDQRLLTKEVCEAADQRPRNSGAQASEHEELASRLKCENEELQQKLKAQQAQEQILRGTVCKAMAAADTAMQMHAGHVRQIEMLRASKLADAIHEKVELHIAVPKTTLCFSQSSPISISVGESLQGGSRIYDFLQREVFPHFDPLWVRLDGLDKAPDGSSRKEYAKRMLERLTDATKSVILEAQKDELPPGSLLSPVAVNDDDKDVAGNPGAGVSAKASRSLGDVGRAVKGPREGAVITGGSAAAADPRGGSAAGGGRGASGGANSISAMDRERLLQMLRDGDDRGLDSKICDLLQTQK
eukprot:TRINITY_DN20990_c0_g1_i1.p1 TRINITY_DN20990_c0_g1~~TRINITY_DN20990_c0_g1_i1.p1  ORF type:complete len:505 (+),score=92.66 TRINITY_DN20990_c0_g1_i1:42-1556(+)